MYGKKNYWLLCILAVGLVVWGAGAVEAVETSTDQGTIDWERGVITVRGEGAAPERIQGEAQSKLLARRAAEVIAYRNALQVIEKVRIDSKTEVEDYVVKSDRVEAEVSGYVRGGRVVDTEYGPAGLCVVTMEFPIDGQEGLTSFLERSVREDSSQKRLEDIDDYLEQGPPEDSDREPETDVGDHTGIVIDARGYNLEPALYPQVFDSEGYSLYGPAQVGPDRPEGTSSLVAYARDKEKALAIDRVGDNPIVVEAVSVINREGEVPTDVILDSEAAETFRTLNEKQSIVASRAVVFLIN